VCRAPGPELPVGGKAIEGFAEGHTSVSARPRKELPKVPLPRGAPRSEAGRTTRGLCSLQETSCPAHRHLAGHARLEHTHRRPSGQRIAAASA
jgi:hypothetical protein